VLWGKEDHTVPFFFSDTIRAAFPQAEFHAIDGAGHLPQLEQPEELNRVLWEFCALV